MLTSNLLLKNPELFYTQSNWNHRGGGKRENPMSIDKLCDWGE